MITGDTMDIYQKISKFCIKFITNNLDKTEEELEQIEYGLQVLLINILKLSILFLIAYVLGIVKYTSIAFISFSILRSFASGVHADSNLKCTLTNILLFLGNVYISTHFVFSFYILIFFFLISLFLIILYAPADTEDRPLISKKLRKKLKIGSIIVTCLLGLVSIYTGNLIYSSLIILSILEEAFLITPFAYKIFGRSYKNYLQF